MRGGWPGLRVVRRWVEGCSEVVYCRYCLEVVVMVGFHVPAEVVGTLLARE